MKVLEKIKVELQKLLGNELKEVILFGSRANGTAMKDSDYDIVIILNKVEYDWIYNQKIYDIIYDIELEENIFVDLHIISEKELDESLRGAQPFFQKAVKEGIYI